MERYLFLDSSAESLIRFLSLSLKRKNWIALFVESRKHLLRENYNLLRLARFSVNKLHLDNFAVICYFLGFLRFLESLEIGNIDVEAFESFAGLAFI